MKTRILLVLAAASVAATQVLAGIPPARTPDSGSTAGVLVVGLLAVVALRKKLTK